MESTALLWALAIILAITGLAGLVLPLLPGAPLLFLAAVFGAWAENFEYVGLGTLAVLGVLTLLSLVVDWWSTMLGAKRFGASKLAIIGALIGSLTGVFLGFPGIFFCPFIGAVIGELLARRDFREATRAGIGATIGFVLGAALKLALAFAMIGIFMFVRFFRP